LTGSADDQYSAPFVIVSGPEESDLLYCTLKIIMTQMDGIAGRLRIEVGATVRLAEPAPPLIFFQFCARPPADI